MKRKMIKQGKKGITLVALVITIIILLILAGVAIGTLGGKNGLISKANQAKKAQIIAEMKEKLTLAITELQTEKAGRATLDDITQEWANNALEDYKTTITTDPTINGKKIKMTKSNITGNYIIDEKLGITENNMGIEFSYEAKGRIENKVKISIHIQDTENGIDKIEFPDGGIIECFGRIEYSKDNYEVEIGKEYKIKITSKNGDTKEEKILISDYWYNITKNLSEGIEVDNIAVKAAYNKPYEATLIIQENYAITELTVTMGGQAVTTSGNDIVDITTGKIYIEKVTEDIEITVKTKAIPEGTAEGAIIFGETTWTNGKAGVTISTNETSFYIEYQINGTTGAWTKGTSLGASVTVSNLNNNSTIYARLTDGTHSGKYATLTIADIEGPEEFTITVTNTSETSIKIEGSTTDTASGIKDYTYVVKTTDGAVVNTKEHTTDTSYEVTGLTNGRKYTVYMIAYDNAGNETKSNEKTITVQEAINYATEGVVAYDAGKWTQTEINNLGSLYNYNSSHTGSSSLQFTFGGFKAGDSRNISVAPRMGAGKNRYEGWIILESEVKNEKIYIKSIVHAGAPENFVYDFSNKDTSGLTAEYILSSGKRQTSYKTSKGSRNWDMYKDQSKLNFINNVYCLTLNDVNKIEQNDIRRRTGGNYFLATSYKFSDEEATLRYCRHDGSIERVGTTQGAECFGVRPVVTFVDGVYAVSGTGTGDDPYILGIDN